jgi:glycosyltransferase involved in cell wall biosynthesis
MGPAMGRDTVGSMGEEMKLISVVSPCYNEEGNVGVLTDRVRELFAEMPQYRYEHIIIDNNSTDGTVDELRKIAAQDKNVKVIVNARNLDTSDLRTMRCWRPRETR